MKNFFSAIPISVVAVLVAVVVIGAVTRSEPIPADVAAAAPSDDMVETKVQDPAAYMKASIDQAFELQRAVADQAMHDATMNTRAYLREEYRKTLARQKKREAAERKKARAGKKESAVREKDAAQQEGEVENGVEDVAAFAQEQIVEETSAEQEQIADVDEAISEAVQEVAQQKNTSGKKKNSAKKNRSQGQQTASGASQSEQAHTILVSIAIAGGQSYTVNVPAGSTVQAAMAAAGVQMQLRSFGGLGAYVEGINGVREDTAAGLFWIFRINGAKSAAGISAATLNDGDEVYWQLEPLQ